ncbi:FAD-dependent oxidoreductase, partial [Kaarinaea lacus]
SQSRIRSVSVSCNNQKEVLSARHFISTIPLPVLVKSLDPKPPEQVMRAASGLRSRDLVTVTLMLDHPRVTEHTWIYVPEKKIPFGRIHEPTNWSDSMAPPGKSLLVIEYFCFRGDSTWSSSDEELVSRTRECLDGLGIIKESDVIDGVVLRIPNAYPLFNVGYEDNCRTIYQYLSGFENLYTAGRGGMFRYYNMDHTMLAGFDVAESVLKKQSMARQTVATI